MLYFCILCNNAVTVRNVIGTVGRRERKKLETRSALHRAALQLIASRGLAHVTVAEIADAADVSERTFFNHFPCKEDAVVGRDEDRIQVLRALLAEEPADATPLAALRSVLTTIGAKLTEHREELLLQRTIIHANPALRARELSEFAQYERELAIDVARRANLSVDHDLYPLLTARAAVSAFRAAITLWCTPGNDQPLAELIDSAFGQLAKGLPPPLP